MGATLEGIGETNSGSKPLTRTSTTTSRRGQRHAENTGRASEPLFFCASETLSRKRRPPPPQTYGPLFFSRRLVLSPPLFAYQPAFFSFLLYLRVCWRVWSCTTSAGSLATRSRYAARRRRSVVPGSPRTHSTGTLSLTGTTRRPSVLPRASCRRFSQPLAAEPTEALRGTHEMSAHPLLHEATLRFQTTAEEGVDNRRRRYD